MTESDDRPALGNLGLRASTRRQLLLLLLVTLPFLFVQPAQLTLRGWQPTGDNGIAATRALDVITDRSPTLGMVTSLQADEGNSPNHPGPAWFWVLAPFALVFGASAGLPLASTALIAWSLGLIAWSSWRARSVHFAVLSYAFSGLSVAVMSVAVGVPSNSRTAPTLLLAAMFLSWRARSRDSAVFTPLVLLCSLLAQMHVQYAPVAAGLLVWAASAWRDSPAHLWIAIRRSALRTAGLLFAAALWIPPVGNALMNNGGNARRLIDAAAGDEGMSAGIAGLIDLVNRVFDPRPPYSWWGADRPAAVAGVGAVAVLGACVFAVCRFATRSKGLQSASTMLDTAIVGVVSGSVSAIGLPATGFNGSQVLFEGVLMLFTWFSVGTAVADLLRSPEPMPTKEHDRTLRRPIPVALGVGAVMVLAGFPFPMSVLPDSDVFSQLGDASAATVAALGPDREVVVIRRGGRRSESVMNGLVPKLTAGGVSVLVDPGSAPQWGTQRAFDGSPTEPHWMIVVTEPGAGALADLGGEVARISAPGWDVGSANRIDTDIVRAVRGRGDLRLTGEGLQRLGEFIDGRTSDPCTKLSDFARSPNMLLDTSPAAVRALVAEGLIASPTLPTELVHAAIEIQQQHPIAIYLIRMRQGHESDITYETPINEVACPAHK